MAPSLMLGRFYLNFSSIKKYFNIYIYSKFEAYNGPWLKLRVDLFYMKVTIY